MHVGRLPADEAALRRYIEDLWIPYNRELETIVEGFALADDVDLVAEELAYRLDRHRAESYRGWVAVDGSHAADRLADVEGEFAGFVTTDIDECPSTFDRPDRLVRWDIYVRGAHRRTGLATDLVDRARARARDCGGEELELEVDVANERASTFYESLGFEPYRDIMVADATGQ